MRDGAEYFTEPASAAQRRYEALRAYFTDEMPAAEVADRFGYSTASIHQMATLLRKGRLNLFTGTRPGPKGPRKATGTLRDPGAGAARRRAFGHRDRRRVHSRGDAGVGADLLADPRRRGAAAAAPPRRRPPRPAGQARPGQGRRAARLAGRAAGPAVRSRRAAAVVPRHLRRRPAGPDQPVPATPRPGNCHPGSRSGRCCWPSAPASPASPTPGRWPTTPGWRSRSA